MENSTAFPDACVFPGGNLDANQDGKLSEAQDKRLHEDGEVYRIAAIRECFEESGLLLAKRAGKDRLLEVEDCEREKTRKAVHSNEVKFTAWVRDRGGVLDTGMVEMVCSTHYCFC